MPILSYFRHMDLKQIKELISLINDSQIGELLIEKEDFRIRIRHQNFQKKATVIAGSAVPSAAVQATHAPAESPEKPTSKQPQEEAASESIDTENLITVRSPMIGTFYRASSPDKPPYAKVGDSVDKGDVLCIIEAMKLFNEIESEYSGTIVKVLVENEAPVEYDQPLFLLDPAG